MSLLDFFLPDWTWVHRDRVHLLWVVLVLIGGLAALEWRGHDSLGRFLSPVMQRRLVTRPSVERTAVRLVLLTIALFAMVLAVMRPQSMTTSESATITRASGDVMVVLDVSKSMLAEDVAPNRLVRARAEIAEMVKQLPGQRVGLVAFAGRAVMLCPLTPDESFFNLALRGVDTRTVARGGTRIGEAVEEALKSFSDEPGAKLIVLITDGEDHESNPLEAAKHAKAAGVRIIAVGLGSEEGSPITITDPRTGARTQLTHDNQPVISRLDGATLRQMALETGGAYVPAGTSALDLESIVRENITPILRAEADKAAQPVPTEEYPWMVALALVALVASVGVGAYSGEEPMKRALVIVAIVLAAGCMEGPPSKARVRYNDGVALLESGKATEAVTAFLDARGDAGFDDELRFRAAFNLGMAYAKQGETAAGEGESHDASAAIEHYRQASAWFADAKRLRPGDGETQANLERVQARILALIDEANQGENGLERRLEQLIEGERGLRDAARGLWQAQDARTAPDPLADKDAFDAQATRQRIVGAEAGVVADLTGDEITSIGGKAEAQRNDQEKSRLVQLQNLDLYIQDARKEMVDARRNLAELRGELAYRRTEGALVSLKRAREQLLDPVTVLRGVAQEHVQLMQYTAAVDEARTGVKLGQAPPEIPKWMEPVALGGQQLELQARVEEVRARLAAGAAAPAPDPAAGAQDPQAAAQAEAQAKVKVQIAAALPSVEAASAAMQRASEALRGGDVKAGGVAQREALEAMARAIEQFLDLRGLIDLALGEQGGVVTALTPPAEGQPAMAAAERAQIVGDGAAHNRERVGRMQQMIADELAKASAADGEGADEQAKQQTAALYAQAETLRGEAQAALDQLLVIAKGGKGAPALDSARTAQQKLEEMQRLFFSVVEHLKRLIRDQGETSDQTAEAVALDDLSRKPKLPGLVQRETEHSGLADSIAQALAAQADAAAQPPQGGQPAPQGGPSPASLREAAGEVRNALGSMQDATTDLTKASDPTATMSFDLSPVLTAQQQAIEHLENALRLLQPPPKQDEQKQDEQKQDEQQQQDPQKQDQQQQQQQADQSKDDAERRLQQVREREAQRQREKNEQQRIQPEPVDKDW